MENVNLKEMTLKELEFFLETAGEKKFRARQVFAWMYGDMNEKHRQPVYDFDQMTDIPASLRQKMKELAHLGQIRQEQVQISDRDGTRKYLFALADGSLIESVLMSHGYGNSVCISSQAGCRMGCTFCASASRNLERNLSGAEMMDQILMIQKDIDQKISKVVIMGIGEPFDNYENLSRFLQLACAKEGLNMGMRNITVSTCGILPKIKAFGKDFPQVNLAVSLHASNDAVRRILMPVHNGYTLEELLSVCKSHTKETRRRITFEYALIDAVNDAPSYARELAGKLRGMLCHVNLIPLNPVKENQFYGSKKGTAENFKTILETAGITTTIRREMGNDIDGACGQLRANVSKIEKI